MDDKHPTYPNPTIQEALCEIHFRLPDGVAWEPTLFGELFKRIQSEFPNLEPITQVSVQFLAGPDRVGQTMLLPPQQRMRYKHASRNLLLQMSERIFTVNVLPKYEGWARMSKDILVAWTKVREVVKPAGITRIGLRYINRIERTRADELPRDWLAPSDYIPKAVLSSLPGFLSRLQIRTDPHNRLVVTVGDPATGAEQVANAIVLDIDCIVEKEIEIRDNAIIEEITLLHDSAWNVFVASMTPRLEELLNKEVNDEQ